jgi:hypothetical protein
VVRTGKGKQLVKPLKNRLADYGGSTIQLKRRLFVEVTKASDASSDRLAVTVLGNRGAGQAATGLVPWHCTHLQSPEYRYPVVLA